MRTLSLEDLQRRIDDRDSELQRLRQALEARQNQLTSLTQRKEALQGQLQQIEAEMAAVATGSKRSPTATPKPAERKPSAKPSSAGRTARPSLPSLLVSLIQEAGQPLTVKQLVQQVKRQGFKSKSANFRKMVEVRIYDLRKKGILQRAADQAGYALSDRAGSQGET